VGLGLGLVPFGGAAEAAATATKIIDVGTREARIGLAVGEIFGGLITASIGIGGGAAGTVLTLTGLGAVAGVPALVGSATLLTGGAANVGAGAAGLWEALSTGGGGADRIRTIGSDLKNIRAIGSGRLAGFQRGNTSLPGGQSGARSTFQQLTGKAPGAEFDRVVLPDGREIVFRELAHQVQQKLRSWILRKDF
jgi:hypothetical protein